ncbi:MAG: [FeFe] hydrogenase H-cluster radical SAM maturase HydG [Planctomycetes bacterium]|jgi:2-iminoacetate synthase|nr:[FeFe] hydrogenase H-cluster radical SAM maturase HydG [Planctomycetota bacterium]
MCALAVQKLSENAVDFIDEDLINGILANATGQAGPVRDALAKSLSKQALNLDETAQLLNAEDPALLEEIFDAARKLKREVYGNRIVLFAPLYVGSYCINDCRYCGFKRSNPDAVRRTLTQEEIRAQVTAMEDAGHKRLILVFGEHPWYGPEFIAQTAKTVYGVRSGHGEIRRANINAAPLDHEGYKIVKDAGIGTYQVFQETYHHKTYAAMHPPMTHKSDYMWRLDALSRAMEAGQDDVGIGALFGISPWKFEAMGLVAHSLHLQDRYGCGPHTISFPRLKPASGVTINSRFALSDQGFKHLVAVLRLAVPYTGMICTARESAQVRREVMAFGVSQIDAGTRIEIGGYTESGDSQCMEKEQFTIGDVRSLDDVMGELLRDGYIPSFCTACYRLGRTGEHFMEFAIPGFIKRYCTPNALTTLMEYLVDYSSPATRTAGEMAINAELAKMPEDDKKVQLVDRLNRIRAKGDRDLYI